ncbi:bifunctional DedA family/phosphatase PAP2 family protein [Pseudomonas syringae]|jgi:membrane protein DedA with SNARE-associated domain|uniref:bifunctional DedA family/phosphatase PAP2 family protein n=1 Tax=Pseudomonas syringae TaxID=317 RepID=UPI0018E60128|nr:bifunctional DedA family/phosphatase PAP2 family protein [Pseudomonas syringae]MBI6740870.1 bifunctional DedA family/phosphatase PAP2 family protein [Pseudomonas syringae]MBI6745775.1 bifunctional DedA family/phosphatase PAP2 family protein [Pseudomonas syringae]MBI6760529.1 bifunctional DedA family/phosphatase PAP2 family protein [Pseudomonas syringae]MBI6804967.1 bifunctional DedA family/phosphatase PAP2 family protein [Pseudomonas syringae]MBI6825065.1 bifunctional DedA family/phosphatas
MGDLLNGMTGWLTANPSWVAVAIFLVAFIECVAIVGIVVPGTVIMFAIAALAGSGILPLSEVLLLGFLGGLLGDAVSYFVGRRFHQNIRQLPGLRTHPEWMEGAEKYFHRYGIASLLVGRFIGPLRPMLPMIAGMCDMPLPRFVAVSVLAAAGWSIAYLMPGWAAGAAIRLPLPEGFWPEAAVVGGGLAVLFGLSIQSSIRQKRYATRLISALSLMLVATLFFGFPLLADFDNGLMTLIQEHRSEATQHIVVFVTSIGDFRAQLLAASLLIIVLAVARQWRHAAFALTATLGTAIANGILKTFFARARPEVLLEPLTTYSMPSGHSSAAFALFMTLGVLAGRGQPVRLRLTWMLVAGIPALAIALSRVYLGVHWPTDILAGMLLAFCVCAASLAFIQRKAPLPAMSVRVWWLVVPAMTALLGIFAVRALSHGVLRYQY